MRLLTYSFLLITISVIPMNNEALATEFAYDPTVSLIDSPSSIIAVNHIGLSVQNLEKALEFYQGATGFEVVHRETVQGNATADALYARENVVIETATLLAPNWLLELSEFTHNASAEQVDMPAIGPGMTHTCYQSPKTDPGYEKFAKQGARILNRNDEPVHSDLYGVSYIYAHDPEGNLLELEQLEGDTLVEAGYPGAWEQAGKSMWMSQVSLFTPNRDRLMAFYQDVLQIKPNRSVEVEPNEFGDNLFDLDDAHVKIGWFRLNKKSKMMEILQFINPPTPEPAAERFPGDLGYTFSLEVTDIEQEYQRLKDLDVHFFSEPKQLGRFWQVFARDIDGNIFSLRQLVDADSAFSAKSFDPEN